jgi:glycosyltransferase involved in cell wall biosynthesis
MPHPNSVSIIVPALNEEEKLDWSVRTTLDVAKRWFDEIEILIFDDGSTDHTPVIADALAAELPEVRVIHRTHPSGLGGVLKSGLEMACMTYFFWVDGKGATTAEALEQVFAAREQADLVILYAVNQHERPFDRRLISAGFRGLLNLMFGLHLRQHTHPTLCRTAMARRFEVRTTSHAFQAELLIKMIKGGCTYAEVGAHDDFMRQRHHSKAYRLSNIAGVGVFFVQLLYDVHVRRSHRRVAASERR